MDLGLYSISADREVEVREHDLDVDYEPSVSEIKRRFRQPAQDKDVKKVKGTRNKSIIRI